MLVVIGFFFWWSIYISTLVKWMTFIHIIQVFMMYPHQFSNRNQVASKLHKDERFANSQLSCLWHVLYNLSSPKKVPLKSMVKVEHNFIFFIFEYEPFNFLSRSFVKWWLGHIVNSYDVQTAMCLLLWIKILYRASCRMWQLNYSQCRNFLMKWCFPLDKR